MNRSRLKRLALGFIVVFALAAVLPFVPHALAQIPSADLAAVGNTGIPVTDIRIIVARLIRIVISLLGIVLVALIIYAGILYMLARGDKDKVQDAWKIIRNAIIGLAIVLASYVITTFVLNALLRAAGLSGTSLTGSSGVIEPLSGSLGAGIIQDHYPPRGGFDIPRNTKIIVTFKEPIAFDSILASGSYDPSAALVTGDLNANNVKIYKTSDTVSGALSSAQVDVAVTADRKTFVFDPVALLGSPIESQNYSVFLSPAIQKLLPDFSTTAPAFPAPYDDGYLWNFQVSTVVDITPPQVQSWIPLPNALYARNILVQVTFNEAVDPTSTTGVFQLTSDVLLDFNNIQVRNDSAAGAPVEGTYIISTGYRTVEFITFDACGENACGGTIYCLPGSSNFTLFVRAAPLGAEPPQALFGPAGYGGVADVAGNSLDGGGEEALLKNLIAQGPPIAVNALAVDNFWSDFSTDNTLNTNRPHLDAILPAQNQPDVSVDQDVEITFNEPMRFSTLTNANIGLTPRPAHELWYRVGAQNVANVVASVVTGTVAIIEHGLFLDYIAGGPLQNYYPIVNNEVSTAYQICYYPAYGPPSNCGVSAAQPSCCFGAASSSSACSIPTSISSP